MLPEGKIIVLGSICEILDDMVQYLGSPINIIFSLSGTIIHQTYRTKKTKIY